MNEFRLWAAFYVLEAEASLPPDKRPRRPVDPATACNEINRLFGIAQ